MKKQIVLVLIVGLLGALASATHAQTTTSPVNVVPLLGGLKIVNDPCKTAARQSYPISIGSVATTRLGPAAAANKKIFICSLFLYAWGTVNVAIVEGASTCASPTGVVGGATTGAGIPLSSTAPGFMIGSGDAAIAATASANVDLCLVTSASTQLTGVAMIAQQ